MTEEDAKTKWCPKARPGAVRPDDCGEIRGNRMMDGSPDPGALCIGSACAVWRRQHRFVDEHGFGVDAPAGSGFCGLAGPVQ